MKDYYEIERRRCRKLYLRLRRKTPARRARAVTRAKRLIEVCGRLDESSV